MTDTGRRRLQDVLGAALMGDAVIHMLGGGRHWRLWTEGMSRSPYTRFLRYLSAHPIVNRLLAAGMFALGLSLTRRAEGPGAERG